MIYVICNNDSLEAATKDKKTASKELERLAKSTWEAQVRIWGSRQTFEEYRDINFWHIHLVKEVR